MLIVDAKAIPAWNRAAFEDMRKGRLNAVNLICSIWEDFEQSMRRLAELKTLIAENSDIIYLVREAKDITRERDTMLAHLAYARRCRLLLRTEL